MAEAWLCCHRTSSPTAVGIMGRGQPGGLRGVGCCAPRMGGHVGHARRLTCGPGRGYCGRVADLPSLVRSLGLTRLVQDGVNLSLVGGLTGWRSPPLPMAPSKPGAFQMTASRSSRCRLEIGALQHIE